MTEQLAPENKQLTFPPAHSVETADVWLGSPNDDKHFYRSGMGTKMSKQILGELRAHELAHPTKPDAFDMKGSTRNDGAAHRVEG